MVVAAPRHVGDEAAVTQDDDPIRKLDDLSEAVRDEDDAGPTLCHSTNSDEELFGLIPVKRCRRLVEHEDVVGVLPAVQASRDRDDGPLGRGERVDPRCDIEVAAVRGDQGLSVLAFGAPRVRPERPASELAIETEVLDCREGPDQTEVLTANLGPGVYTAMCNLPGHYTGGMSFEFVVH